MKTNIRFFGLLFVLVTALAICPKQASAQQDHVSMQVFYDELSPYGQWIDHPKYGYSWLHNAGADFAPYSTRGRWIFTDYGWTWLSDYEWGWAPFHYGRWDYDSYYGWLWVPDYEWGPSWVTWRRASGYYGWQPMRPGISLNLSFGNEYYNDYNDHWFFVRERDFQRKNISRHYISQTNRDQIIRNSTVIRNTYNDNRRNSTYISGPDRNDVERFSGKKVGSVSIRENSSPGQDLRDGQLRIYRPQVRTNSELGQKPAPDRITDRQEVRRPSEKNATYQQRNVSTPENNRQERQLNNERQRNDNNIANPSQQQNNRQEKSTNNKQENKRRRN